MGVLIFDLDGTLVDSLPGIAASLNRALLKLGYDAHPADAVRTFIGNGSRELANRALGNPADEPRIDALEAAFKADYAVTWRDGTAAFPGIPELLRDLAAAGHSLTVLSNKPHPFTEEIVAEIFPEVSFEVVLGQRLGVPCKPDPTAALEIASRLNLPPGQCTIIGDSTMDLETAAHAGMRTIAVTWGYQDVEVLVGAERIVADPMQLQRAIC